MSVLFIGPLQIVFVLFLTGESSDIKIKTVRNYLNLQYTSNYNINSNNNSTSITPTVIGHNTSYYIPPHSREPGASGGVLLSQ